MSGESDGTEEVMGYTRKDVSGLFQKIRSKKNIEYGSPEGEKFFAKYVTRGPGNRDNISGLIKEKNFLDFLADTGIVPKAGELKIYPNGNKARLILEKIPGVSLDNVPEGESDLIKQKAEEVILATGSAHQRILDKGVAVVDVNPGTYILNILPNGISAKVVDFEIAVEAGKEDGMKSAISWYRSKDPWLRLEKADLLSPQQIRQEEIYLWAKTMVERLAGPMDYWKVEIPADVKVEYEKQADRIRPFFEHERRVNAERDYERLSDDQKGEEKKERFVDYVVRTTIPFDIRSALGGLMLEAQLKTVGIELPEKVVNFLSAALHPDVSVRPDSFESLLDLPSSVLNS